MNQVTETAEWVSQRSVHVRIDPDSLARIAERAIRDRLRIPPWEAKYHFQDGTIRTVWYFLVLDSLNFCFWSLNDEPRWEIQWGKEFLSGYYALAASLKEAFRSGAPVTDPEYLAGISRAELKRILKGSGELQLMDKRAQIVQELGQVILSVYGGKAERLLEEAGGSALRLARILAAKFTSFRDESAYQGMKVFFYKRAQIMAADLYGAFGGKGWGAFSDMDRLTAFADYKLPQVLRQLGALCYEEELAQKVDSLTLIEAGSADEVEIRANTLWAVELLRKELHTRGRDWKSYEIDWMLWNMGQEDKFRQKPYHRTVTIFY